MMRYARRFPADFDSLLRRLQALPRFGEGPGLHRMAVLREALPEDVHGPLPPSIRITGTNGKGSTAAMVAAVLTELGFETGLYTSPHFLHWNERIAVDGEPVGEDHLAPALAWFFEAAEAYGAEHPGDGFSAFEAATAVALHVYGRLRPDALVVEAGMGGRLDPSQIFPGDLVGLTSLDLEHTEVLGETLLEIALDKADLCPDGGVLGVGRIETETSRRLTGSVSLRNVEVLSVPRDASVTVNRVDASGTRFHLTLPPRAWLPELDWQDVHLAFPGAHQADNAALAVLLVREWLAAHGPHVGAGALKDAVRRAFSRVRVPGRMERVGSGEPQVYVDVAHTPEAIRALAATVGEMFGEAFPVLLIGVSQGRDPAMLLRPLVERGDVVVVTRPSARGAEPDHVARAVRSVAPEARIETIGDVESACNRAMGWARDLDRPVLVTGSLFLAQDVGWALAHPTRR